MRCAGWGFARGCPEACMSRGPERMFGKLFGCVTPRGTSAAYAITNGSQAFQNPKPKTFDLQLFLCARVDSNHHPVYTGQGPQPYSPAPYTSARVQIVRSVRGCGHVGHIGRNDLCQRCVTDKLANRCPKVPFGSCLTGRGRPDDSLTRRVPGCGSLRSTDRPAGPAVVVCAYTK
jgi:hypothetical protein